MKVKYTSKEALTASLKYFNGDELAAKTWVKKYALKDADENLFELTPDDMHHRLAKEFARAEKKYSNPIGEDEIYELLKDFKYIVPQGSPMAGMGNDHQIVSLSNCFVTGEPYDSYGGILWTDQQLAQLYKRRCGVGTDISHIRPAKMHVSNAALTTTGVIPFMDRYSNTTREVAMEGRRGALLLSYDVKGMDASDFIDAKKNQLKVTGANISIKLGDDFLKAVKTDGMFKQQYPIDSNNPIASREIEAKKLWNQIVDNAWSDAEPGILFWDTAKNESIGDHYKEEGFNIISTNPCGEILLCLNDSCRLLLLNLLSYVINPFTPNARVDMELFRKHVQIAERLMDDIVDLELEKIDKILAKVASDPEPDYIKSNEVKLWNNIKQKAINGRRTGLGLTALGDMIAALGMTYGTPEATKFASDLMKDITLSTYHSSVTLAKERGAFPIFDFEKERGNPFLKRLYHADPSLEKRMRKYGRRGISLNTISPAGSVSIETQTTSGIEPAFMVRYRRRRKINPMDNNDESVFIDEMGDHWEEYDVLHKPFTDWLVKNGYDVDETRILPKEEFDEVVKKSPYYNATANEIDWREKVKMQGVMQQWIDHSISNTTNLPETATKEDVSELYMMAWENGCKGVTVYREGSRSGVLIAVEEKPEVKVPAETHAIPRPKTVNCDVIRFMNSSEKWIAFIGFVEEKPYEIFTGLLEGFPIPNFVDGGKIRRVKDNGRGSRYDFIYIDKGGFEQTIVGLNRVFKPEFWTYAKLISGLLRNRMHLISLVHTIKSLNSDDDEINTWFNGVVRILKKYIKNGSEDPKEVPCPYCGAKLQYSEGCLKCNSCNEYAKC